MKDFSNINHFLLPTRFRKYGLIMIFGGLPAILIFLSVLVFNFNDPNFPEYWNEWGGYILHIPLSMGLFWMLFAAEKEEDEMFLSMRLKAMFHGVKFVFAAILMLPIFTMVTYYIGISDQLRPPEIGGNLAVVTLLLLYAYGSFLWLKKKAASEDGE